MSFKENRTRETPYVSHLASARGKTGKSTARIARIVTSIICARYVLSEDSRVGSGSLAVAGAGAAVCPPQSSPWKLGERSGVGDAWGEGTPPDGRGVPDSCGGKRK